MTMDQFTALGYIFEKVPPLYNIQIQVLKSYQYNNKLLGALVFVDATTLGFYAHQPYLIWTNLSLFHMLIKVFFRSKQPLSCHIDDIMDDNQISLVFTKANESPLNFIKRGKYLGGYFL